MVGGNDYLLAPAPVVSQFEFEAASLLRQLAA
jgi:hypothetical protein